MNTMYKYIRGDYRNCNKLFALRSLRRTRNYDLRLEKMRFKHRLQKKYSGICSVDAKCAGPLCPHILLNKKYTERPSPKGACQYFPTIYIFMIFFF